MHMHVTPSAVAAPVQNEFGLQMRRARKDARLSQKQLADQIGVNPETITRVERGFNTRVETMIKIRQALPSLTLYSDPKVADQVTITREALQDQRARIALTDLQGRIIHLVQAIHNVERLQRIQAAALKALAYDLDVLEGEHVLPPPVTRVKPEKKKNR